MNQSQDDGDDLCSCSNQQLDTLDDSAFEGHEDHFYISVFH